MNELPDDETTTPPPGGPAPWSPGALRDGCRCSVLLNQAGPGPDDEQGGFVNPLCPVHGSLGSDAGPDRDPGLPVRS
jgi:hypothetical protein